MWQKWQIREGPFAYGCQSDSLEWSESTGAPWIFPVGNSSIIQAWNNFEPLLGVIREQGEWPFTHKGAGSKGQNSQGSREHENCYHRALFVSKRAAESKPLTNLVSIKQAYFHKSAYGLFSAHIIWEHAPKNQGACKKVKKEQGAKKNQKGAEEKLKGREDGKMQGSREQRLKMWREQGERTPPNRASIWSFIPVPELYPAKFNFSC